MVEIIIALFLEHREIETFGLQIIRIVRTIVWNILRFSNHLTPSHSSASWKSKTDIDHSPAIFSARLLDVQSFQIFVLFWFHVLLVSLRFSSNWKY